MSRIKMNLRATTAIIALGAALVLPASTALAQSAVIDETVEGKEVMVVTATRTELDLSDAPASMSVITAEDMQLTATVDVLDAVRQTPGITFRGRGVGSRQVLTVRGMGSDQTLFMIDGRRTLGSDNVFGHSNFQYNWVPMNAIERIEIVRGPLSSLYGSDALGGVINVITKPVTDQWTGSAAARYTLAEGEGDEQFIGLHGAGPIGDKVGLLLSYTFNDVEDVPLQADPTLTELEGKQAHNLYGRVTFEPADGHRFDVDLTITKEDRFRNTNSRGRPPTYEGSYDLNKFQYGASYSGEFEKFDAQLNYYHAEFEQLNFRTLGLRPSSPQTIKNDVIDGHVVVPMGASHRVVIGGEYRTETLVHPFIAGGEGSINYGGLFAQNEWKLSDKLLVTIGARWDDHENFGSEFSPRVYAVYHATERLTFKGGYGHGFRSPTIKQSSPEYRFTGPHSFVGNANVGPETSDNFEGGFTFDGDRFRFAATAFVNNVNDLITTQCFMNCASRFGRVFTYVNLAETETKGIESEIDFDVNQWFSFGASHVYMDTEDKTTGLRLAGRPEHIFSAQATVRMENPGITATLRANAHTSEVEYSRSGMVLNLPGYTLWHAQGAWDFTDATQVTFGVKNLGNLSLAEKSANFGYAERGRSFYLGLRQTF